MQNSAHNSSAPAAPTVPLAVHFARLAVGVVFAWNVLCAGEFILRPELYAPGFELSGAIGRAVVQAFGILFLMWNATYPPVIAQPLRQRTLFLVILAQQTIGLLGESWLLLQMPLEHTVIRSSVLRFILFDGAGLLLMALSFWLLHGRRRRV